MGENLALVDDEAEFLSDEELECRMAMGVELGGVEEEAVEEIDEEHLESLFVLNGLFTVPTNFKSLEGTNHSR